MKEQRQIANNADFQTWPPLGPGARILILAPHPDDETLGAGGLIAMARSQGFLVRVVFLTNGDGSVSTRLMEDMRFVQKIARGKNCKKMAKSSNLYCTLGSMRQREATAALARLHVTRENIIFLGYPDGGLSTLWKTKWSPSRTYRSPYTKADRSPYTNSWTPKAPYCGRQVLMDLKEILIDFKPTVVITTHPEDTHSDHWAAHAFLNAAVAQLQLQQKYFSWASRIRYESFVIHRGLWPVPRGYHPNNSLAPPPALLNEDIEWFQLPLDQKAQKAKADALQCYCSQFSSTPQFLRSFLRCNEFFGQRAIPVSCNSITHHPARDSLLSRWIPAGGITKLWLEDKGKVLLLGIVLDGKPRRGLKYIIHLHLVSAHCVALQKIVIQAGKHRQWSAILHSSNSNETPLTTALNVHVKNTQIIVQLPLDLLAHQSQQEQALFISASSALGRRTLDQTPTWVVRRWNSTNDPA